MVGHLLLHKHGAGVGKALKRSFWEIPHDRVMIHNDSYF